MQNGVGPAVGTLEVRKHLSGGVQISLGAVAAVISPADAMKFAVAILKAADVPVRFDPPAGKVVAPSILRA